MDFRLDSGVVGLRVSSARRAPLPPPHQRSDMLAVLHVVGAAYVPQLALSRAAAPPRAAAPYPPLVPERLRPLSMAVEGTGPGMGDYIYFVAVLALLPLIVGSVGSSVRLPNGPTSPCHTRLRSPRTPPRATALRRGRERGGLPEGAAARAAAGG